MGRCEVIYKTKLDAENAAACLEEFSIPELSGKMFNFSTMLSSENLLEKSRYVVKNKPDPKKPEKIEKQNQNKEEIKESLQQIAPKV